MLLLGRYTDEIPPKQWLVVEERTKKLLLSADDGEEPPQEATGLPTAVASASLVV